MALSLPTSLFFIPNKSKNQWFNPSSSKGNVFWTSSCTNNTRSGNQLVMFSKRAEERIREFLQRENVELSPSSYDTAWAAMVPSQKFPDSPCFPQCLDWILDNQNPNGSWGIDYQNPSLVKDALSCTLACLLALRRWRIGKEHVRRGLYFIGSKFLEAKNEQLCSPIGFKIIFPGMIEAAREMGLDLPVCEDDIDDMLRVRELELQRCIASSDPKPSMLGVQSWHRTAHVVLAIHNGHVCLLTCGMIKVSFRMLNGHRRSNSEGNRAYLAYVAEGLGKCQDWQLVMRYQRKNGSLFNSPSTTAAALTFVKDENALKYLQMLLLKFGRSVSTAYPLNIYTQLCVIDKLDRLGVAWHFRNDIKVILDRAYRSWVQKEAEIVLDPTTCAIAFRLLRMHGYNVSSDVLAQFHEDNSFIISLREDHSMNSVLELYKASQFQISSTEQILENLNAWATHILERQSSLKGVSGSRDSLNEVKFALKFPFHADLDRLEHKRNIEDYNIEDSHLLKSAYNSLGVKNQDLLELSMEDFNTSQSLYRKELKDLERWVQENKLDQLGFARQKLTYCYLSASSTLFIPEMTDARLSWAKNGVLTTVVDDFFDIGGSKEELENLIGLVEKWDAVKEYDFVSEQVKIVFDALYTTISDLGAKASMSQKRNVTGHLVEIWLNLLKAMMKEAELQRSKSVPSLDEYMQNGYISFALGPIILPALYFVGAYLSEDAIRDPEYDNLFRLVSTCGRLLNDMQSFERESKEGKLNSVSLRILHSHGSISEEEAKREMRGMIISNRTELLKLVLSKEGSMVPRECKDLFWKMCKILHVFYRNNDGFTSQKEMLGSVNAVIHEPLKVGHLMQVSF